MSAPQLRIPVGIVLERRRATSPWAEVLWRPAAVLAGLPDAAAWTPLARDGATTTYYAGAAEIELYGSEVDNYRRGLAAEAPAVWVAIETTGGDPACAIVAVTADPAEGEALTEAGQLIVEAVAMPEPIRAAVAAFVEQYPVRQGFTKRKRDRADLEALGRRGPAGGKPHEPR
jgi:hypothetical protein